MKIIVSHMEPARFSRLVAVVNHAKAHIGDQWLISRIQSVEDRKGELKVVTTQPVNVVERLVIHSAFANAWEAVGEEPSESCIVI